MPSDFYSEKCFFEMFINIQEVVKNDKCNIGLIGIKPVEPSDQYGYILKDKNGNSKFLEKPNIEKAKKLIEKGAF